MVIFGYWESFSKFYRNLGLNEIVIENMKTKLVEKIRNGNSLVSTDHFWKLPFYLVVNCRYEFGIF
jgi:hypothetical protein